MPLKLEIKKLLSARTDRVKSVDFHPTEPWVLAGLYSGAVMIWDYNTQALVRQMEVSNLPIRCAKFIVRRQWIIVGCDDMTIKILNYNTLERIKSLEGHSDYIRYIAVHPTLPLVLTSSDDMTIKMWDWDQNWECTHTFEGHSHYVMMVQWNPKDSSSFASASLDRSIKIWGLSGAAHFALNGHQRGVNCIDFATGDKPYLVSGSDDKTVRVWDYQTKQCVHVLEGHSANVSSVVYHPTLPLILSGSEDGLCKLWHATTFRLETSLNYVLDRLWSVSVLPKGGNNAIALGYDEGTVVIKLGSDEPVVSYCGGKLIWAKGVDIQTVNLKQLEMTQLASVEEGESISSILSVKDMGACELFPQSLAHHPSGRMFAVCGDGEYVIYTAQALRNKSFGRAIGFAWSPEGHYATRDGNGKITIFHNFKEAFSFKPDFAIDEIHSGELLAVRGPDFVVFYDWNEYRVVRRIDVVATDVLWSETGKYVVIASSDSLFMLSFDRDAVIAAQAGGAHPEEGIEIAFELHNEVQETVKSGVWVSDSCFVFTNNRLKLNTLVGGQVEVLAHLDRPLTVLGYLPELGRMFCCDKALNVSSFELDLNLVRYKSAIACNDFATAESLFALIPEVHHTKLARFLEAQGFRSEALDITKDTDHKFELALALGRLEVASNLLSTMGRTDEGSLNAKRKQIGDKALETGDLKLAESCFLAARDASSLLLLASCSGDMKLLGSIADIARTGKKVNIEITARMLMGDYKGCVEALLRAKKSAEALVFARTYCPSMIATVFPTWKSEIETLNPQLAKAIADPSVHADLFPGLKESLVAESVFDRMGPVSADKLGQARSLAAELDVVEEIKNGGEAGLVKKLSSFGKVNAPTEVPKVVVLPGAESPKVISKDEFKSPSSSPVRSMVAPVRATMPSPPVLNPSPTSTGSSARLPTPPALPSRTGAVIRGPPPIPSRTVPVRSPEVQEPNKAPETTTDDVDLL
jgi:coatomer subunit beta'